MKHYSAAQPIFALARKALEEAPDVEDSSVASVEANEARLLSEQGEVEKAAEIFERARKATGSGASEALSLAQMGGDTSNLVMVHVLHARVLQLYGQHCMKHGREKEGEEMAASVKAMEVQFGFSSA